jgi:hypothetical protein
MREHDLQLQPKRKRRYVGSTDIDPNSSTFLAGMRDRLTRKFTKLANAYSRETLAAKNLYQAIDQLDVLRNNLEGLAVSEHQPFNGEEPGIYWPPHEHRISVF